MPLCIHRYIYLHHSLVFCPYPYFLSILYFLTAVIQVVSPITGQEIGMLEMRVAKNRESIRSMKVRILSGLRLEVQADPTDQGRYTLQTAYSQLLRSKYQVRNIHIDFYTILNLVLYIFLVVFVIFREIIFSFQNRYTQNHFSKPHDTFSYSPH